MLAAACAAAGVPLIHISTDYVFDGSKHGAYVERRSDRAHQRLWAQQGRGRARGARGRRRATSSSAHPGFMASSGTIFSRRCCALAATRDELRVVADQRGCPTSTPDLAEAILRVAPRLPRARTSGAPIISPERGVTTWHGFASPHRRRASAADRAHAARDRDHDRRIIRRRRAGLPIRNSTAAGSSVCSAFAAVPWTGGDRRASRALWSSREPRDEASCRVRASFSRAAPERGCIR